MKFIKWENGQVVDEYRKDEMPRGHGDFIPTAKPHPLGFVTLAIFIVLVVLVIGV